MKIDITKNWTVADLLDHVQNADAGSVLEFVKPAKPKTRECWCGCGEETRGGKFVPGHDSKFHSLAKQVARGAADMPESFVCDEAEEDFMMWHDREIPLHAARIAAKETLKAAKAAAKAAKAAKAEADEILGDEATETSETEEQIDDLLAELAS